MSIEESNKLTIFLDFDGTVVEHEYPRIGRENFGCMTVIEKLQKAGHLIILNTYRADISILELEKALSFINNHPEADIKSISPTDGKLAPPPWNWESIHKYGYMWIDDKALNIPLKDAVMTSGKMVDWDVLDKQFEEHGLYNSQQSNTTP